ncbi:hypothetical protein Pelo_19100 [Pelomyxa schiedti]|nr:hypothetical protein Pelo_19100 [Pelomyxa schiedti]
MRGHWTKEENHKFFQTLEEKGFSFKKKPTQDMVEAVAPFFAPRDIRGIREHWNYIARTPRSHPKKRMSNDEYEPELNSPPATDLSPEQPQSPPPVETTTTTSSEIPSDDGVKMTQSEQTLLDLAQLGGNKTNLKSCDTEQFTELAKKCGARNLALKRDSVVPTKREVVSTPSPGKTKKPRICGSPCCYVSESEAFYHVWIPDAPGVLSHVVPRLIFKLGATPQISLTPTSLIISPTPPPPMGTEEKLMNGMTDPWVVQFPSVVSVTTREKGSASQKINGWHRVTVAKQQEKISLL